VKNGFIFIVMATGKTAAQMLAILEERLQNPREVEIQRAGSEQAKITALRLRKIG
jgi:2-oxo-4-hydroxy-4-carboxy-5-ureidoimidazoline decarboxylase